MNPLKYRAWAYIDCYQQNPVTGKWKGAWKLCDVLTLHLNCNKTRLRFHYEGEFEGLVKVVDVKIGKYCTIIPSTGIEDVHTSEIFAGDILKTTHPMTTKVITGLVKWNKNGYWELKDKHGNFIDFLWKLQKAEIVGNIYQNPQLGFDIIK